jgi:hypothetical protein
VVDGELQCRRCDEWKPADEDHFHRNNSRRIPFQDWCRECQNGHIEAQYRSGLKRDWTLRHRFGITALDYERILASQGGVCAFCRRPERARVGRRGGVKRLAVDHCHDTGEVRRLLCTACNTAYGKLEERPETIARLLDAAREDAWRRQRALLRPA